MYLCMCLCRNHPFHWGWYGIYTHWMSTDPVQKSCWIYVLCNPTANNDWLSYWLRSHHIVKEITSSERDARWITMDLNISANDHLARSQTSPMTWKLKLCICTKSVRSCFVGSKTQFGGAEEIDRVWGSIRDQRVHESNSVLIINSYSLILSRCLIPTNINWLTPTKPAWFVS